MVLGRILPRQVFVVASNPVPQKTKDEPAKGEGGNKEQEDETPPDLNKGGPEVCDEGKVVAVLHVAILNVAAAIFGHKPAPTNSSC